MKKLIFSFVLLLSFTPLLTSAQSTTELQAMIQSLLQQISTLQAKINQLNPSGTSDLPPETNSSEWCFIDSSLYLGSRGSKVRQLQVFLVNKGYLTTDNLTAYFGPNTEAALKRFQSDNNIEQTGNTGPITRAKIKLSCPSTSTDVVNTPPQIVNHTPRITESGGSIWISSISTHEFKFVATDDDGDPLYWSVDWGDGSSFSNSYGSSVTSFQSILKTSHPYNSPGIYKGIVSVTDNRGSKISAAFQVYVDQPSTSVSTITVLSPNGGEKWQNGSTQTIKWSDTAGIQNTYTVFITRSNGGAYGIAGEVYGQNSFNWTVGKVTLGDEQVSLANGSDYYVQIVRQHTEAHAYDQSNGGFSIVSATTQVPLSITNSSPLPNAKVGTGYQLIMNVLPSSMPTNQLSWSTVSGSLPDGLRLTPSDLGQIITGTPTLAGTYNFTISAALPPSVGTSGYTSKQFTLTVEPAASTVLLPSIYSISPSQGGPQTEVIIYGSNLGGASNIEFLNSSGLPIGSLVPSSVSSNYVKFTVSEIFAANMIPGVYQVRVVTNACPGGCDSNKLGFTLSAPTSNNAVPTASLTANGVAGAISLNTNSTVTYNWSSTNADNAYSSYTVSPAYTSNSNCGGFIGSGPFPWVANTLSGSITATAESCQAGRVYTITYTASKTGGQSVTSILKQYFAGTRNDVSSAYTNTSINSSDMANVLNSMGALLEGMLKSLR